MSKKEAIEKIAGYLGDDVLSMSTTNNESGLTTDSSVSSKDNSSAKGKITLEEFFARTDKVVLNIPTQEEFSALVKILKDLGITTNSGREFKEGMWQKYEHLTIISPERKIGAGVEIAKHHGYEVINFKDLDLEKYLSQEELTKLGIDTSSKEVEESVQIFDDLNSSNDSQLYDNQYKITIDEFWECKGNMVIHCDEEWKANILMKVFDRMGKTWGTGRKYTQDNNFDEYKSDTCYVNDALFDNKTWCETEGIPVYPFDKVDLSKYLTQEQVDEIKNKLGFDPLQNNQSRNETYKYLSEIFGFAPLQNNQETQSVQSSVTQGTQNISTQKPNTQNTQSQNVQNSQNAQSQKVSTPSVSYDITVDEFWEAQKQGKELAIHCDQEWKVKILIDIFNRIGKYTTFQHKNAYTKYGDFRGNTCYSNYWDWCTKGWYASRNISVYPFDKVDLSKYLTPDEAMIIVAMSGAWWEFVKPEDMKKIADRFGFDESLVDIML